MAYAAYESGWEENFNKKFRRDILMIMKRADRPQRFRVAGYITISMTSFTSVSIFPIRDCIVAWPEDQIQFL